MSERQANLAHAAQQAPTPILTPRDWERFFRFVQKSEGCWNWTGSLTTHGKYGQFNLRGRILKAHRLSLFLSTREWCASLMACHTCNNPRCVNPDHLYWGTARDNNMDAKKSGTMYLIPPMKGEDSPSAKLTASTVKIIRERHAAGDSLPLLAKEYGIARQTAWHITTRRTWKNL